MTTPDPQQLARAETRIFKAVFPNSANHYDTLFGGTTLHIMDEVVFITATYSRLKMVTVSSDKADFTHPHSRRHPRAYASNLRSSCSAIFAGAG